MLFTNCRFKLSKSSFSVRAMRSAVVLVLCIVLCTSPSFLVCADEPKLSLGEYLRTNSAVSEAEAMAIALRFVRAANEGDAETCGRLFNVADMVDRQNQDLDVSVAFRNSLVAGAKESRVEFANLRKSGGDYTVLRAIQRESGPRVIVRMVQEQFGLNYHELMFDRDEKGFARISDIYILSLGETMGSNFRQLLLAGYADEQSPLMAKVYSNQVQASEIARSLKRIPTLVMTDPKQALKEIANLPKELRNQKGLRILRLNAASSVDETEYKTAYEAYAKAYPGDPSLDLHGISYHFDRSEFIASRAAAERLKLAIGGDTKLDEIIARINEATIKAALNYKSLEDANPTKVLRRFIASPRSFSVRDWSGRLTEVEIHGAKGPNGRLARFRLNRFQGIEGYVDTFDTHANAQKALDHIQDDPKHCLLFPDSDEETEFLVYKDVRPENGNLIEYQCGKRRGLFAGAAVPEGIPVIISVRVTKDVPESKNVSGDSMNQLFNAINLRHVGEKMSAEAKAIQRIMCELGL